MKKIRSGDLVIVNTGGKALKGKTGIVKQCIGDDYVIVEGLKLAKKAVKPNPAVNQPGGFQTIEMPIHISNVALVNPETGKGEKVRIMIEPVEGGKAKKFRVFQKSGKPVPEPKKVEAK